MVEGVILIYFQEKGRKGTGVTHCTAVKKIKNK